MAAGGVTAIVLAAGASRRMGSLKPLLPYGSGSVIEAVIRSLKASPVEPVLVVLGHCSDEIAARIPDVDVVLNPRYADGMLTSVQAGVAAAPPETEWLLIVLGDQPSLRPELVTRLLEAAKSRAEGESIVAPSYGGRRGHPLLIHARWRAEIAALRPEAGLRELLRRHPEAVRHVDVPDDCVLSDMDTPEEYERELRRLREGLQGEADMGETDPAPPPATPLE